MEALLKTSNLLGEGEGKNEVMQSLQALTEKMNRLKAIGQELSRMRGASDFEIETGKMVNMQELMNREIQKVAFEMQQLFQQIEFQVKDVRKKFKS
jgi:lipoate synthase